jgi:aminopeptidase-like protein
LDDLNLVTPKGLTGGANALFGAIWLLENNEYLRTTVLGEPQLGKRGLYPDVSDMQQDYSYVMKMTNVLSYADGKVDLITLANTINESPFDLQGIVNTLKKHGLLEVVEGEG